MSDLIIIGAGGFGLEVAAYAEDMTRAGKADFTLKGFLDDTKLSPGRWAGYPVLGPIQSPYDPDVLYVIAVGAPESRKSLADKLYTGGAKLTSVVHPQSYVAAGAAVGAGTIVAPFAFVGPAAEVGQNCLLNTHTSVGHESRLGDFCVLSPFAGVHGGSRLGEGVFMGSHAYATRITIGAHARISAGAVVYNDAPAGALAIGNPAAFRKA